MAGLRHLGWQLGCPCDTVLGREPAATATRTTQVRAVKHKKPRGRRSLYSFLCLGFHCEADGP